MNHPASTEQLARTIRAVQGGVRWLRDAAPHMDDSRWIAVTISALVAAERNPHSTLVQRLVAELVHQQRGNGSWNDELWDTTWALMALHSVGFAPDQPAIQAGLRFIEATQDPVDGTWYEEPWETMLVLDTQVRFDPKRVETMGAGAITWLLGLQREDGLLVGTRYTGMAISLLGQIPHDSDGKRRHAQDRAISYLRSCLSARPIWTGAAWSNYYALKALLDAGLPRDDPDVARAIDWFLESQDEEGKWHQVAEVPDTAMSIIVLSRLLTTPLVDLIPPKVGIVSAIRENGTLQVSYHSPGTGAVSPIERIKLSSETRAELGQNQQRIFSIVREAARGTQTDAVRPHLAKPVQDELVRIGRLTYGAVVPSRIQVALDRSRADHLRLEIDERLMDLPWELIHDGSEFLCLRYAMGRRIVSDQQEELRKQGRGRAEMRALVVANPSGDLPAAEDEGIRLAALMKNECRMGVDFFRREEITKSDFLLALENYDIIHFAGHADHDPDNPDEGHLRFSDGQLQAFELRPFLQRSAPKVVFLNACWSAEEWGNGESHSPLIRGLGRTFLYAGTSAFVGYRMPVRDSSAQQFAIGFYESIAQGQTIGESMRRARLRIRNPQRPDDLTWASAILYGDPSARVVIPPRDP